MTALYSPQEQHNSSPMMSMRTGGLGDYLAGLPEGANNQQLLSLTGYETVLHYHRDNIRGNTDAAIVTLSSLESDMARTGLCILFELKKKVEQRHISQALCQLVLANVLNSSQRPVAVLTDLVERWQLLWLAGRTVYSTVMSRGSAVAAIKLPPPPSQSVRCCGAPRCAWHACSPSITSRSVLQLGSSVWQSGAVQLLAEPLLQVGVGGVLQPRVCMCPGNLLVWVALQYLQVLLVLALCRCWCRGPTGSRAPTGFRRQPWPLRQPCWQCGRSDVGHETHAHSSRGCC
jgi:hypothetical protein